MKINNGLHPPVGQLGLDGGVVVNPTAHARPEQADAEQARREQVLIDRMARYEDIGQQWADSGAGKKQREATIFMEKKILRATRAAGMKSWCKFGKKALFQGQRPSNFQYHNCETHIQQHLQIHSRLNYGHQMTMQ